jgi:outer membrane cobalamin receptor
MLKGAYNKWSVEKNAYGRPEMEFNTGITLHPAGNLTLGLDYYLAAGRKTYVSGTGDEKMKNINELNVTGSYTINDTFGAYLKLNNLLFQEYELFYGYPLQGFNVMAGITIHF